MGITINFDHWDIRYKYVYMGYYSIKTEFNLL